MKYAIAYSLYQKLKSDPKLAKRVAIIAAVGAGFGLVCFGLSILKYIIAICLNNFRDDNY